MKILLVNPHHLKLNEWGDFLAGFIAPLAFLWIGFGVYYQKKEFANIVESFNLQKEEFQKSVGVMEEQVIQIEIQQYNTWFNRNIKSLSDTKEVLFKNIKVDEIDSIFPIYKALKINIEAENSFFNIFDEIKLMVDISENVNSFIKSELDKLDLDLKLRSVLLDLQKEFKLLQADDAKYCKKIIQKIFILIVAGKEVDTYKRYQEFYNSWIEDDSIIKNFIDSQKKETFKDKVKVAFDIIDNTDFNTIKVNI